jgi:NAD(P)-dependent dehydrogenase (short-subunit alcohol dehydrogenase family)
MGVGPGIGLAIAKRMAAADRGYHVAMVARRLEALEGEQREAASALRVVAQLLASPCQCTIKRKKRWRWARIALWNRASLHSIDHVACLHGTNL